MRLRLDNYAKPFEAASLAPHVRAQIEHIADANGYDFEGAKAAWAVLELVDVIDVATGATKYQLYLYPWGERPLV